MYVKNFHENSNSKKTYVKFYRKYFDYLQRTHNSKQRNEIPKYLNKNILMIIYKLNTKYFNKLF